MKKALMVIIAVALLSGCATTNPQVGQLTQTIRAACDLYVQVKPEVLAYRAYAKANWDKIPPKEQELLLKLDSYLPKLDEGGQVVCTAAAATDLISPQQKNVNWDEVLSVLMKAASTAMELKKQGVI